MSYNGHQLPSRSRKKCKTISSVEKCVLTNSLLKCFQMLFICCIFFQNSNMAGEAHWIPDLFQTNYRIVEAMETFSIVMAAGALCKDELFVSHIISEMNQI